LSFMNPRQLIETNFSMIDPEATLGELVKVVATSTRNIFPVVDRSGNFYGIVTLDIIRQIMFDQSLYEITYVKGLMVWPDRTLDPDDPMDVIVQLFDRSDLYNLPVLKEGKYLGFISRARIFSQYREMLRKFSED